MIRGKYITYNGHLASRIAAVLLAVLMIAGGMAVCRVSAETGSTTNTATNTKDTAAEQERPVREVHKVAVGDKQYCFFAMHYVVLTPEEIAGMSDEELTAEVLKRSGVYMKEANCHKSTHKEIKPEDWAKTGGTMFLSEEDLANLRAAKPAEGEPVKMAMDLRLTTEPATEEKPEPQVYTTYKRTSPRILFAAVAVPADAALGEEICEEEKEEPAKEEEPKKETTPQKKQTTPKKQNKKEKAVPAEPEEMLPEYRTISMTDRSGGPIEETLKDGEAVELEWIEPGKKGDSGKSSFLSHKPALAACIGLLAAVVIAAAVYAAKRNREED